MRLAAIRALEIRDEAAIIHGMTRGELEARALEAERVPASAPPDVARQLRLTAQAEADAWQQYADAALQRDRTQAANAGTLARQLAAERQQLEAANARYVQWSAVTSSTTEAAASARDELKHRSLTWKPAEPSQRQMAAPEPHGRSGSDRQLAQIDRLLAQAAAAAGRVVGEHAERESRAEYTARAERGAQAQSVPALEDPGPVRRGNGAVSRPSPPLRSGPVSAAIKFALKTSFIHLLFISKSAERCRR